MVFKIILGIFLYLLCGVGVLEIMQYHDRNVHWTDTWVDDNDMMKACVILFMPFALIFVVSYYFFYALGLGALAFRKGVVTVFATLIYFTKALITGRKNNETNRR